MKKSLRKNTRKIAWAVGATLSAVSLLPISGEMAHANKKEKAYLPDYVLNAKTVLVVILPDGGEPMDDPLANRKAQEEVEKAFMKWGRYQLALDKYTADLVIGVKKGTGKIANPTINGGSVDVHSGTIETTDSQIRVAVQQGRPPDVAQQGAPAGPTHTGVEVGAEDDAFKVFQGGTEYPVDNPPVWKYIAKDGLKPPHVAAVEEFRKAVEESEKAAAQRQQKRQRQAQKKNP